MTRPPAPAGDLVRSKRARSETDNYFDILEMHWISTAGDLDAAYEKIRNEFSRNAYVQLGAELIADVDAIAGQIQLAYNNLRDETRRSLSAFGPSEPDRRPTTTSTSSRCTGSARPAT